MLLTKGSNTALPAAVNQWHVVIHWEGEPGSVDGSALLLGADGKVRCDGDFVFYNQPSDASGAVTYLSCESAAPEQRMAIDLEAVAADVQTIAFVASTHVGLLSAFGNLKAALLDPAGTPALEFTAPNLDQERAIVMIELYRRKDIWRLRAVGQGWSDGLSGLARDFGVEVDDSPESDEVLKPVAPADALPSTVASLPTAKDVAPVVPGAQQSTVSIPGQRKTSKSAVQTRKTTIAKAQFVSKLAEDPCWQEARLFSISAVGGAAEQEKRATSALLATIVAVKPFARALLARLNAPAGSVETFLEVAFPVGDVKVVPDGVIRISRGARLWTALVEVKTSGTPLRVEQVQSYVDVARRKKYDAVLTISNDLTASLGDLAVSVRSRRADPNLFHLSWSEVLHEARMALRHRGVDDPTQSWILHELIRYLEHPKSGAAAFDDMGPGWVAVRESVVSGTLRAADRKVPPVAESWQRLIRQLCLNLTADLGQEVVQVMPRKMRLDPTVRMQSIIDELAATGSMSAGLTIPGTAGALTVRANLRTSTIEVSTQIDAPQEWGSRRRVSWLLKQLNAAPKDLLVEVVFSEESVQTCRKLLDALANPAVLVPDSSLEVAGFNLSLNTAMGTKRSGISRTAFPVSVLEACAAFHTSVLIRLKPWVAPERTMTSS